MATKIIHLNSSDYKSMPWANGLGMTTELAVEKHDPPRDDSPFIWRISIAGVNEDGPFSTFSNIDRNLMLIDGNGITLDGGPHGVGVLFEEFQVYGFPGDIELSGKLADGPILDLNLMVDRRFAKGDISGFNVNTPERLALKGDVNFIHLLNGSAPVTLDIEGELTVLESGSSLRIENINQNVVILPMGSNEKVSKVVFIAIDLIDKEI